MKVKQFNLRLVLAALIFGMLSGPVHAAFIKNFEFNVDGTLPSAGPDTTLANNTGVAENALYNVSGGFLEQRTFSVNGNASYGTPNGGLSGSLLTSADSFSMEARLRISSINGLGGSFFQVFDGLHRYSVFFSPGTVNVLGASGFDAFAVDLSQFHTFRIESQGNSNEFDFFIDGVLTHSDVAGINTTLNGFNFGDGITAAGTGADTDWDYIRFAQPASETEIVAPSGALFIPLFVLGLLIARRRLI